MANSPSWQEQLVRRYMELPEFIRDDLLEGILVGGGIALPVALMANQDPHEQAAAILGGITAATLGGAAAKTIGARIGAHLHPGELERGSFQANLGRMMGRKNTIREAIVEDLMGQGPPPTITGEHFGRAIGRAVGDETSGIAGTIGALALAQAMDSTPDPQPQPTLSDVAWGTIPGAAVGLLASNLLGGLIDVPGLNRAVNEGDASIDALRQNLAFRKRANA
jgi:hypothetical protein